ncbi:hypothetical protein LSAT2_010163 [Lamellibrachia satsuma]|nr:hypothetical protein LSAT2_010163 [Lamellibrachia satsuma]
MNVRHKTTLGMGFYPLCAPCSLLYRGESQLSPKGKTRFRRSLDAFRPFACLVPGCGRTFCHRRHMLRHQTDKHGRLPRKKPLNLPLITTSPGITMALLNTSDVPQPPSATEALPPDKETADINGAEHTISVTQIASTSETTAKLE